MQRLIDADALERDGWRMHRIVQIDEKTMESQIRKPTDFPTVDAEPVRHGKWISTEKLYGYENVIRRKGIVCSACDAEFLVSDYHFIEDFRYCPNCGARMDEE